MKGGSLIVGLGIRSLRPYHTRKKEMTDMPQIRRIVDLSHALTADTPVYPGDPVPSFSVATTIEKEGYNLFTVVLGSQTGTHVDAPYHFRNRGATVDKMDLQYFMGKGLIIDVAHKKTKEEIQLTEIKTHEKQIEAADIVLFKTNWYKKAGRSDFYEHPFLSRDGGKYLLSKGIKTVGIDAINLDSTGGTEFPIHDMFAEAGGIIAENLANLDLVDFAAPFIIFLPLKLVGCDGSPVRAVAVDLGWQQGERSRGFPVVPMGPR
jgi:kynurenine formamidase